MAKMKKKRKENKNASFLHILFWHLFKRNEITQGIRIYFGDQKKRTQTLFSRRIKIEERRISFRKKKKKKKKAHVPREFGNK